MSPKHGCDGAAPEERGVQVRSVEESYKHSLSPGERIVAMDGETIEDLLDYHHRLAIRDEAEDGPLTVSVIDREGSRREQILEGDLSGIEFEPLNFRSCGNNCVFCFIHQMPRGMREELYVQDEDYRLGFLFGNYVTLALAREEELERILRQNLSPQYVSVHATDPELRNRLLGLKKSRDILETIRRLVEGGITVHAQVVLLPGWNDGEALDRTLGDLSALWPGVASLGIVPVGLTRHREDLPRLEPFDAEGAARVLDQVGSFQQRSLGERESRFAYLADEFYLLAGRCLPAAEDYEDFPQLDNGIGMGRDFVDRVLEEAAAWQAPSRLLRAGILTGKLGGRLFEEYLAKPLAALENLELTLEVLENGLFGSGVTVSGLLPGQELLSAALNRLEGQDVLLLPPNTLNAEESFLDDLTLAEFRERLPLPVLVPEEGLLGGLKDFHSDQEEA